MMEDYRNHLVSGAALERTLKEIHTDQQRQDSERSELSGRIDDIEAAGASALTPQEISNLWDKTD